MRVFLRAHGSRLAFARIIKARFLLDRAATFVDRERAVRGHISAGVIDCRGGGRIGVGAGGGSGQGHVVAHPERTGDIRVVEGADSDSPVGDDRVARVIVRRAGDGEHTAADEGDRSRLR